MLKESTMKRYTVEQLTGHLVSKSGRFIWVNDSLYILRESREGNIETYFFLLSVSSYNEERIKQLIREHT